ncbi:MAG: hypothetical protein IJK81_07145 [Selenomonadaceae bacterium]|nr:hypothetical protein [Selenomonadaceae bacterium]
MSNNSGANLDERITSLERQVAVVAAKVDALSDKIDLVVTEMQANRARQDEDIREIRARQDTDMKEIREILNNNVRNMFITVIIGVGAMVVAVLMK